MWDLSGSLMKISNPCEERKWDKERARFVILTKSFILFSPHTGFLSLITCVCVCVFMLRERLREKYPSGDFRPSVHRSIFDSACWECMTSLVLQSVGLSRLWSPFCHFSLHVQGHLSLTTLCLNQASLVTVCHTLFLPSNPSTV